MGDKKEHEDSLVYASSQQSMNYYMKIIYMEYLDMKFKDKDDMRVYCKLDK